MCVKHCFELDSNYKGIYQFVGSDRRIEMRWNIGVCAPVPRQKKSGSKMIPGNEQCN